MNNTIYQILLMTIFSIIFYNCNINKENNYHINNTASQNLEYLYQEIERKQIAIEDLEVFIRAFKKEKELELWVKSKQNQQYHLLMTYAVCKSSGKLGPKRKEGDYQVPEGVYYINIFNPESQFHLSLGINYPNEADVFHSDKEQPGSDIYIHGNCITIGCLPLTDSKIEEVYTLAEIAQNNGQKQIPVHIFPFRLNDEALAHYQNHQYYSFWKEELQAIYLFFEKNKMIPQVQVNDRGEYFIY